MNDLASPALSKIIMNIVLKSWSLISATKLAYNIKTANSHTDNNIIFLMGYKFFHSVILTIFIFTTIILLPSSSDKTKPHYLLLHLPAFCKSYQ